MQKDNNIIILLVDLSDAISKSNKIDIEEIIKKLVNIEYYPSSTPYTEKHNKTISDMVLEFGIDWCEYSSPTMCPNCCEDLKSKDGPPFKKEIAIINYESEIVVDVVCPACKCSILTNKEYKDEDLEFTEYFN